MNSKSLVTLFAAVGLALLGASARAQTAADPNLYFGEYSNEDVFHVSQTGTDKTTFIPGFGSGHRFSGIAFDPFGNLFVTTGGGVSGQGNEVRKFSPTGTFLGNFVTGLGLPIAVAIDSTGNAYIATSSSVNKYNAAGSLLYTLSSGLSTPSGIAFDTSGNVFVSSYGNGTIHKFSPTGADLGIFVSGVGNTQGIAIDPFNNVFVGSRGLNNVQKFSATGAQLATYLGFNDPLNLTSDSSGNIYVANYAGNAAGAGSIMKISSAGVNLGAITTGLTGAYGVAFRVPPTSTAAAPEPGALPLALIGLSSLLVVRRRTALTGKV